MQPVDSVQQIHTVDSLRDVTRPGKRWQRPKVLRDVEEQGSASIIYNPIFNKGTNFTFEEREAKGIEGLLPPVYETLDMQAERLILQLRADHLRDIQRYNILKEFMMTDQQLFYKVLIDHIAELAPIIYTPTVGEACQKFDSIYRGALGMYISAFRHRGRMREVLANWPSHNVQIAVVTDGSRILGLGDLGTNGIGISIGKIALYVAGAGFHPEHSLPIVLDVGCNREELVHSKSYLGEKRPRLEGGEYYAAIDEFCDAFKANWPNALLQFEDFQTERAFQILHRKRHHQLCFNDDIQGTGAVVAAGVVNGMQVQGTPLGEARIAFFGAGSSAVGVADTIAAYIAGQTGITREEARRAIYLVDSKGLVSAFRGDKLPEHKVMFARTDDTPQMKDLVEIIKYVKPHALVGLSGAGPSWPQPVMEALCSVCPSEHPLVFPLSNPTAKAEITAEDAYAWCKGKCLFASGSPFDPVTYGGQEYVPGQANNMFIFPGVGFGAVMAKAREVSDAMFGAAVTALSGYMTPEHAARKQLYPAVSELRSVTAQVAAAVAKAAWDEGNSELEAEPEDWLAYVVGRMWLPERASMQSAASVAEIYKAAHPNGKGSASSLQD